MSADMDDILGLSDPNKGKKRPNNGPGGYNKPKKSADSTKKAATKKSLTKSSDPIEAPVPSKSKAPVVMDSIAKLDQELRNSIKSKDVITHILAEENCNPLRNLARIANKDPDEVHKVSDIIRANDMLLKKFLADEKNDGPSNVNNGTVFNIVVQGKYGGDDVGKSGTNNGVIDV